MVASRRKVTQASNSVWPLASPAIASRRALRWPSAETHAASSSARPDSAAIARQTAHTNHRPRCEQTHAADAPIGTHLPRGGRLHGDCQGDRQSQDGDQPDEGGLTVPTNGRCRRVHLVRSSPGWGGFASSGRPSRNLCRSSASSAAVRYRSAGSLYRLHDDRFQVHWHAPVDSPRSGHVVIENLTSQYQAVFARHGRIQRQHFVERCPQRIDVSPPIDQIARAVDLFGDMYRRVPTRSSEPVSVGSVSSRASPKSVIHNCSRVSISRFAGLISRCTIPAACA